MLSAPDKASEYASDIDSVHNYYEHIVLEEIDRQLSDRQESMDFIADVACVALNHLPPRYIRHNVDMAFYLSPKESREMDEKVAASVRKALAFVDQRRDRTADR
jgi:competence protein ComFB